MYIYPYTYVAYVYINTLAMDAVHVIYHGNLGGTPPTNAIPPQEIKPNLRH